MEGTQSEVLAHLKMPCQVGNIRAEYFLYIRKEKYIFFFLIWGVRTRNCFKYRFFASIFDSHVLEEQNDLREFEKRQKSFNPYPTAFPYGNGMVLHFYQQQESSTTKTVHKGINKKLKTYV